MALSNFTAAALAAYRERVAEGAKVDPWQGITLERLAEAPDMGALPLSKAQRALTRAASGLSVDLDPSECFYHFGVEVMPGGDGKPQVVIVRTGVRAGKSLIAGLAMIENALTCVLRRPPGPDEVPGPDGLVGVREGELVRCLIVAPLMSLARATFFHIKGAIQASKKLSGLIVKMGTESLEIRRPDGAVITVELVAAATAGTTLRSTWLAGIVFDEADFHDDEGASVNLEDNYRAVVPRMLEGAQVWITSSPYSDDSQYHEIFTSIFGAKNGKDRCVAFHSDSLSMNPTLDKAAIERERKRDPDNAAREYDAVPRSSASLAWFDRGAIEACCTLPDTSVSSMTGVQWSMPPNEMMGYAGSDLGFKKNSSALAIARQNDKKTQLAYLEERIPPKGTPLSPKAVCKSFGKTCIRYGAKQLRADNWYDLVAIDELNELRQETGVPLAFLPFYPTASAQSEVMTEMRRRMNEGLLELPNNEQLKREMRDVKSRKMQGGIGVFLPKHGSRHADVLMAVALAVTQVPPRAPGHVERGMSQQNVLSF